MKGFFAGKKVGIVGMGESGFWAARLLHRAGVALRCTEGGTVPHRAKRFLRHSRVPFEEGGHSGDFLSGIDLLVPSPGVRPDHLLIRGAARRRIPILSELEVASAFARGPWVAVTGTNGKTTTSHLLAAMLRQEGPCDLCGNVGRAFSQSVFERPDALRRVVEASSFQLRFTERVRPRVAVFLNFRPNHLDWHPHLGDYYRSKWNLAANLRPRDAVVLNEDDPEIQRRGRRFSARRLGFSLHPLKEGVFPEAGWIVRSGRGRKKRLLETASLRLRGEHNLQNVMAACLAAEALGIKEDSIRKACRGFHPLPHRTEPIGSLDGIDFVDDSKSTSADATRAALSSLSRPAVLIAGGRAKERDFSAVRPFLGGRVPFLVLYGESRGLMARSFRGFSAKRSLKNFGEAVREAYARARSGQTVLLSPMAASFDQFSSFEERGCAFRRIFEALKKEHGSDPAR